MLESLKRAKLVMDDEDATEARNKLRTNATVIGLRAGLLHMARSERLWADFGRGALWKPTALGVPSSAGLI